MTADEKALLDAARAAWPSSGTRLVTRILIRRRLRCQRDKKHQDNYPARCKACGVTP